MSEQPEPRVIGMDEVKKISTFAADNKISPERLIVTAVGALLARQGRKATADEMFRLARAVDTGNLRWGTVEELN